MKEDDKRIRFTKNYDDTIHLDMGSWMDLKSSEMGLVCDIINNLPLQAYNIDYKCHQDLTLLSILFNPEMINQGIEKVLHEIRIISGFPNEYKESDIIVHDKKEFARKVLNIKSDRRIYCVSPINPKKNKDKIIEDCKFSRDMGDYMSVIQRYLFMQGKKRLYKVLTILTEKYG